MLYIFLLSLHMILIFAIIALTILQRSSDSSVLVASHKFRPGEVGNIVSKLTYCFIIAFAFNSIVMLYLKSEKHHNLDASKLMKELEKVDNKKDVHKVDKNEVPAN